MLITRIRNVQPFHAVTAAGVTNQGWQAVALVMDDPTIDGRIYESAGMDWRDPPLTLLYQPALEEGHDGAYPVGRIDRIWKAGNQVMMEGLWLDTEEAQASWQMVEDGTVKGVSVDVAVHHLTIPQPEMAMDLPGDLPEGDIEIDVAAEAPTITSGTIIGLTICVQQAVDDAQIVNMVPGETIPEPAPGVTASGAGLVPLHPPLDWFAPPALTEPTAMTITDEGRIYGHLALWGTCHTGMPGRCLPPEKLSGYDSTHDQFHLGDLVTAEGEHIAVGTLSMDGPHADVHQDARAAVAAYDNTTTAVADVRCGNDEYGIWFTGAIRPDMEAVKLRALRASKPSGDWRPMGGTFELVHALATNQPGYPVPRTIFSESVKGEEPIAVMASGWPAHLYHPEPINGDDPQARHRIQALAARASGGLDGLAALAAGE